MPPVAIESVNNGKRVLSAKPDDPGTGDGGSGGGTGTGSSGPCTPVPNIGALQKLTVDPTTRLCIGNIITTLTEYAALQSTIDNAFSSSGSYVGVAGMLDRIATSNDFNVQINEGIIPDVTLPNGNIERINGNTNPSRGSIYTTLNTNYLNTATDISIARTIIHETVHAYFEYGMSKTLDPGYNDFVNANNLLFDKSGNAYADPLGAKQHEQMAVSYVDGITILLYDYAQVNKITSPTSSQTLYEYCHDLAWGGLAGTPAYNFMPSATRARIETNINNENNNTSASTKKKGC